MQLLTLLIITSYYRGWHAISVKPNETYQLRYLQTCLQDTQNWLSHNLLLLNSDKAQAIALGHKHIRSSLSNNIVNLDGTTVRKPGCYLWCWVLHISRMAFFQLHKIAQIWHILSKQAAEKSLHAFVTSRLDYYIVIYCVHFKDSSVNPKCNSR